MLSYETIDVSCMYYKYFPAAFTIVKKKKTIQKYFFYYYTWIDKSNKRQLDYKLSELANVNNISSE